MVSLASILSPFPTPEHASEPPGPAGGRLVSADGKELSLERSHLSVVAQGGIARVVLEQHFQNPFPEPLVVGYQLPLPADGAVSGFRFQVGDRTIAGEVDRRVTARERFEAALASGRTAAILEETRSSLFRQEIGNIPAGATLVAQISVDQPLAWLPEGRWEWRFPTVVGPRYLGAPGRVPDAERVAVDLSLSSIPHRLTLELSIGDPLTGAIESVSHPLARADQDGERFVFADPSGARLDRDLVVRWPVARAEVGLSLAVARPASPVFGGDSFGLLTIVPPEPAAGAAVPRDLIVLIDTSGSMSGRPLEQAQRVILALIDGLGERDRLELIQFSSQPERFHREPMVATAEGKREAAKWVRGLTAGGGTEMHRAVLEALSPLGGAAQRQVVLITDGYIGFEREIVRAVLESLPSSCRLHSVGVGSSVNRSLTAPAARAGGGVEIVIGLGEDAERAARRLLERTAQPILTEVSIQGEALLDFAPRRLPDVYRGSPARIAMRLRSGGGRLTVAARSAAGRFEAAVDMPALALGAGPPAVTALFGREQVEDLEARRTVEPHSEIDPWIERIGLGFRLATRATSWVAIDESISVRAGAERRRIEQPHEIPEGLSVEALGLRPAGAPAGRADTTRAGAIRLSRAAPRRELSGADLAKDKAAPQEIEAGEDLDDLSLAQPGAPAASAMKGALGAPALADEAEEGAASMVRPEPIELPADAPERRVPFGSAAPASSGLEPRKTRGWMLWLWLLLALGGLLLWWWLR